jgi:hypothetical protein
VVPKLYYTSDTPGKVVKTKIADSGSDSADLGLKPEGVTRSESASRI